MKKHIAIIKKLNPKKNDSGIVIETWNIDDWENTLLRKEWKKKFSPSLYKIVQCSEFVKPDWIFKDIDNNNNCILVDSNTGKIDKYYKQIVI